MNKNISEKQFLQEIFEENSYTQKRLLEIMLYQQVNYSANFISQSTVAATLGISLRHANRLIKSLADRHLLIKRRRFNQTSIYQLNPLFFTLSYWLKDKFSILKRFVKTSLLSVLMAAFSTNVVLSQVNINNNPVYSTVDSIVARATPVHGTKRDGDFYKKSGGDENIMENKQSDAIKQASAVLKLTKLGEIKLSVFPQQALLHALALYKPSTAIKNPFDWVFFTAKKHCDRIGRKLDWELYYRQLTRYNITDDKIYIEASIDQTKQMTIQKPKIEPKPLKEFVLSDIIKGKSKEEWNRAAQYAMPADMLNDWEKARNESLCDQG